MRTSERRLQEEQQYGRRGQPHEREERERGLIERVTDEMRSWFGHEEPGGRRRYDEERGEFDERRGGESMMQGEEYMGMGVRRGGQGYGGYGGYGGPGGYYGSQVGQYGGMGGYGPPWQQGGMYGGPQGGMYGGPQGGMYGQRMGYGYGGMRGREEIGGYGGRMQGRFQEGEGERTGMREGMGMREERFEERGRFHGRGPKGYRRPDERILDEVCEILTRHPDIDASEIEVKVNQGKLILSGTVDDRHIKRLVEDLAEDVLGVREVQNQIRVERGGMLGGRGQEQQQQPQQQQQGVSGSPIGRSREA